MKLIVDRPYHNAEMRSAGREAQARSAGREAQAKQRRQRSASEAAQAKKREHQVTLPGVISPR